LEENPLRISLNGGSLASQVCAVPNDDYTSLNIKRAVASLLQLNTAESTFVPQEVSYKSKNIEKYTMIGTMVKWTLIALFLWF